MFERYDPRNWPFSTEALIDTAIVGGLAILAALLLHTVVFFALTRIVRLSASSLDDALLDAVRRPVRWLIIAFALSGVAESDLLVGDGWDALLAFVTPLLLAWTAYRVVDGYANGFQRQIELSDDPVAQRGRQTRIAILSRTIKVAVIIVTIALVLLAIPGVRDIGVTVMASAGLAALAVGAAAQPALKSLIAGLQMAITQPLRIGDLVKIDGQTGRVEEIRMSFVTVRTWDERVLVVPTSRFLDNTFENWSRASEKLTGPVMLHLDPAAEIAPIREEFERFVKAHPLWDGRNVQLLVTDLLAGSLELRLAVSAHTIGDLFTLRCAVREHIVAWIREHQPRALIHRPAEPEAAKPVA